MQTQGYSLSYEHLTVSKILSKMFEISNFINNSVREESLHPVHIFKLSSALSLKEPIRFVLPAFPAKSGNRKKTYSPLPDMGEVLALKKLNDFAKTLSQFYAPGVSILIASDGRVFSDLVGITESDVSSYKAGLQNIIQDFQLPYLRSFDLEDVYSKSMSYTQMRISLERDFARPMELIKKDIQENEESTRLFNGIHRFLKEDFLVLKPDLSKNQVSKISKALSYQVIQRSQAWSFLLAHYFPKDLRFSIHPNLPSSEKFPIKLLDADENWGTPWHRVPVKTHEKWQLMRHEEAQKNGAVLKKFHERYIYFQMESL